MQNQQQQDDDADDDRKRLFQQSDDDLTTRTAFIQRKLQQQSRWQRRRTRRLWERHWMAKGAVLLGVATIIAMVMHSMMRQVQIEEQQHNATTLRVVEKDDSGLPSRPSSNDTMRPQDDDNDDNDKSVVSP